MIQVFQFVLLSGFAIQSNCFHQSFVRDIMLKENIKILTFLDNIGIYLNASQRINQFTYIFQNGREQI